MTGMPPSTASVGENDLQVLTMAVEVAIAMYIGGSAADAHELILQIRPLLQRYTDGDGFKVFLMCESFYGEDLRAHSQFREALELDLSILPKFEMAFGVDHERTMNVRSNIAVDYLRLGRFRDALQVDQRNLEDRRRVLGPDDLIHPQVLQRGSSRPAQPRPLSRIAGHSAQGCQCVRGNRWPGEPFLA